jgi:hypothetical protein
VYGISLKAVALPEDMSAGAAEGNITQDLQVYLHFICRSFSHFLRGDDLVLLRDCDAHGDRHKENDLSMFRRVSGRVPAGQGPSERDVHVTNYRHHSSRGRSDMGSSARLSQRLSSISGLDVNIVEKIYFVGEILIFFDSLKVVVC